MRFDTNFIWAYFVPAILISLVSYVSVFHNHSSKIWSLEVGFHHSELSLQLWNNYQKDTLLSYCATELYTAHRTFACDCMSCTELHCKEVFLKTNSDGNTM